MSSTSASFTNDSSGAASADEVLAQADSLEEVRAKLVTAISDYRADDSDPTSVDSFLVELVELLARDTPRLERRTFCSRGAGILQNWKAAHAAAAKFEERVVNATLKDVFTKADFKEYIQELMFYFGFSEELGEDIMPRSVFSSRRQIGEEVFDEIEDKLGDHPVNESQYKAVATRTLLEIYNSGRVAIRPEEEVSELLELVRAINRNIGLHQEVPWKAFGDILDLFDEVSQ